MLMTGAKNIHCTFCNIYSCLTTKCVLHYVAVSEHIHYCTQPLGVRTVMQCSSCWVPQEWRGSPLCDRPPRTPATPRWLRSSWTRWTRTTTGSWLSPSSGSSLENWPANREASVSRARRLSVSCGFQHSVSQLNLSRQTVISKSFIYCSCGAN